MASTSSSAAVAAMVQRASQQYLECRRSVTAKVDEVKLLDEQIAAVFQQISALSEAPEGEEELSEEAKAAAKSVGHLEVTLAGVEGEEPVPNATITVALDPEYEADEYETVEEVVEKKNVVVTDEHGHVVEDGQAPEEDGESTPRKLKTTTKITRTTIKKRVKKEKEPVVRTVAWTAAAQGEEGEEEEKAAALTFPATFVFDPVQSREAVVTITVAAATAEEDGDEDEEPEPVKEIEFPISSLFQGNALDKWYTTTDEEEEEEPTTITELVEEAVKEAIEEEIAAEKAEEAEEAEEAEKTEEAERTEEAAEEAEEAEKTEEAERTEEAAEEADKSEEAAEAEKTEEDVEEAEKTEEAVEEAEETEEAAEEAAEEAEKTEDAAEEKTEEAEQVQEEPKPAVSRFHVKANFVLSEAEKLSISVVALSKKKQEAEAALLALEREAASLRTKYERLNASQRQLNASSISKPKSSLLGGRFGAGGVPVQRKSWYQSSRERANAFITKHQQLLVSVAMFTGSVCLFHYNGENLLA